MLKPLIFLLLLIPSIHYAQTDTTHLHIFKEQLIKANDNKLAIAKANYNYGVALDREGNIDNAITYLKESLSIALEIPNDSTIAEAANYLGSIYWIEGDCNTSTRYFKQGLESAILSNNIKMIRIAKMNLCGNYNALGENEKAIQMGIEALAIRETENNTEGICYDYVIVGEVFECIGNYEKWESYLNKAYKMKDIPLCADFTHLVKLYNNYGRLAETKEKYDEALAYYDTIIQISKPKAYDQGVGIALLNSALVLQIQEKYKDALSLTDESLQYLGDCSYFIMGRNNIKAELLHKLGRNTEAVDIMNENSQNEDLPLYPELKQKCLSLLYEISHELGDYQAAYNWNDSLKVYETDLSENENKTIIEELETKYQTEKKEQHIELLSAENQIKKQRIVLFISISSSLLLILTFGALLFYRNKRQEIQKREALRQQLLRSQMNPHFLFNALGSIQNYMLNNNTKKAAEYLNNFALLTRAILEHSAAETVILEDEINSLHNYIKLEQMRLQHSFEYNISFDESLEYEFINVPPMLIQPFVENAIKHGLKNKTSGGKLTIKLEDKEDSLEVSIIDNGKGFHLNSPHSNTHKSMSMDIFKKRISILKKAHRQIANSNIKSTIGEGTTVVINIPIID